MKISHWLTASRRQLETAGIATARLDSLVLLEDALGIDRVKLLAYPDTEITQKTQNVLTEQLTRRTKHEPMAYIRGKTEFYGREFLITNAVLEPRPESETMIDSLKSYAANHYGPASTLLHAKTLDSGTNGDTAHTNGLRIADVGTGSGALGITAQLELPEATVDLLEIDIEAMKVAHSNVIKFTSGNTMLKTNLLDGSQENYDILLCNLPYVPDEYAINDAATHEPALALFGGPDGLDLYRTLFQQIQKLSKQPLLILCESLPAQHEALKAIAEQYSYVEDSEDDFIQAFTLNH